MSRHELDVHGEETPHTAIQLHCAQLTGHLAGCDCEQCIRVTAAERQSRAVRVVLDVIPITGGVDDVLSEITRVDGVDVELVEVRLYSQPWGPTEGEEIERLSRREVRVAELVCAGVSRREVARMMAMSPKTFDTHRMHVMRKMRVANEVQLLRLAVLRGWVAL